MKMKHKYELMAIISSRISDGEIDKRVKGLKELLEEVVFEELWGMRPFAYPMKTQDKGYYAVWNFMAGAEAVQELEKTLKLYPDLLRFLLVRVPDEYQPMTLAQIDAGLELLRKQKADKRGGGARSTMPKPAHTEAKMAAPVAAHKPASVEAKPAPEPTTPTVEEKPVEMSKEDKEKKSKAFHQKLEDILSNDDLGL